MKQIIEVYGWKVTQLQNSNSNNVLVLFLFEKDNQKVYSRLDTGKLIFIDKLPFGDLNRDEVLDLYFAIKDYGNE